jgi:CBS domain-containing protein
MTKTVITVGPNDSMDKVHQIFEERNIHHIPVVENNKVLGMISKSDYFQLLHGFTLFKVAKSNAYNQAILRSLLAGEVMTKQLATLRPEDPIRLAADYFRENLFHAIPIVNQDGNLVGIITTYDLINYAFQDPEF